jgi:hypothetical protein
MTRSNVGRNVKRAKQPWWLTGHVVEFRFQTTSGGKSLG